MREGDVLVVTRLARFAKDLTELNRLLDTLAAKRVGLRCLEQGVVDSTEGGWEAVREAIRTCAVFEDDLKRERRREGIQAARTAHPELYRGRPPKIDKARVSALAKEGLKPPEIAARMGIGLASVYRALGPKKAKEAPA
jgi:DNA invertase Pin-like site-specific DNA recombinase